MTKFCALAMALAAFPAFGQLTRDQMLLDFQQLAALLAKQYAPYEWKRDALGFDLYALSPWVARIEAAKDDMDFFDICTEYVASLRDSHTRFLLPSNFYATNGLYLDLYEGKAFLDLVDRGRLPSRLFPIVAGDQVISIDGEPVLEAAARLERYVSSANARARTRQALDLLTFRPQVIFPRAHQVPDAQRWVFRRADGSEIALDIPWDTYGEPVRVLGPVPSPLLQRQASVLPRRKEEGPRTLAALRRVELELPRAVRGVGVVNPSFAAPPGFVRRTAATLVTSGTYRAEGKRIGYLRIPRMYSDANASLALVQIAREAAYLQENTDGLVIDVTRNPGGSVCFTWGALSYFFGARFTVPGVEIRATRDWILRFEQEIQDLELTGAPQWKIDQYAAMLGDVRGAYSENRGRTGPLPLCNVDLNIDPARDFAGNLTGYTKPILVLTDDFSASAAEWFASVIQDNKRGLIFGMPTNGAGGSVASGLTAGWYSESAASVTQSLAVRPANVSSGGEFPVAPYLENIGVRPDIFGDLMTEENLRTGGQPFIQAFTSAIVAHIDEAGAAPAEQ